jgi:mono/diheme cytochrome c family protein
MPAFAGKLSDAEIRAVLAYIESRWSQEVRKLRAEMIANARPR